MKKTRLALLSMIAILTIVPVVGKQITDVIQTIPPITVSTRYAIAGCTLMDVSPGDVVAGASGVNTAMCDNGFPAILLAGPLLSQSVSNTTNETPTFILATGWIAIGLSYQGTNCSPATKAISPLSHQLLKENITSGIPVIFTNQNSNTTLIAGPYNYCLFYSNPPVLGILTFTVSWSP